MEISILLFSITVVLLCFHEHFHYQLNKLKGRTGFFHFRGLFMPRCRSPPFLSEKQADKKEMEETLWQKSIIFISEDKR